jgi:carbonic anhydrase/acetyltransferase-like protein (isoleucine patch superfamily)
MIRSFENTHPRIDSHCYIAENADVIGDIVLGKDCSVWPMTVIRGDVNRIRIGHSSNIQDGSVLHVSHAGDYNPNGAELHIGNYVTVGHKVILHGCRIGNDCLIGMGSIIMDDAVLEDRVMLGAGSLVPQGKTLQGGYLYIGSPCKRARLLSEREIEYLRYSAEHYVRVKDKYLKQQN